MAVLLATTAQVRVLVEYGLNREKAIAMTRVDAAREIDCQQRRNFRSKHAKARAACKTRTIKRKSVIALASEKQES